MADRIKKAVFWWEKAWRHAWIQGECYESEEIGESKGSSGYGEGGMGGSNIVVPCYEAGNEVSQRLIAICARRHTQLYRVYGLRHRN